MESILFVSQYCPGGRVFGSDTRIIQVLRWLAETGRRVHYVHLTRKYFSRPPAKEFSRLLASYHPLHVAGCRVGGIQTLAWKLLTRPRSLFFQRYLSQRLLQRPLAAQLDELLARTGSNVLWVDHAYLATLAAELPRRNGVLRVIDTHDVMHLRDESLRAAGLPIENDVSAHQEQQLLSAFDVVIAIQDQERQALARLLPERTVITVGHPVEATPQPTNSQDICFVGSRYLVNEASLLAFLERAWPAIRAAVPSAKIQVVGGVARCDAIVQAARSDSRIVLRGYVPQAADIYSGPAVVVCPLEVGSGLKIKMVEALAHGKAVVATPTAAQGLEDGTDHAFRLAQRPSDFVGPVVELLRDPNQRQRFEQHAAAYAREHFGAAQVWRELDMVLRAAGSPGLREVLHAA